MKQLFASREVIKDCWIYKELLETEEDNQKFRAYWIGALAVLRAVGHVLRNIDCPDGEKRRICDEAFRVWRTESIFQNFIESSRNDGVKEYKISASEFDIPLAVLGPSHEEIFTLEGVLYRPLNSGGFEGEDARDVYVRAIIWWNSKIDELETKLDAAR